MVRLLRMAMDFLRSAKTCRLAAGVLILSLATDNSRSASAAEAADKSANVHLLPSPPSMSQPRPAREDPQPLMANIPQRLEPSLQREPMSPLGPGAGNPMEKLLEPSIPRSKSIGPNAKLVHSWQEPKALQNYLKELGTSGPAGAWAEEVKRQVRELDYEILQGTASPDATLQRLQNLTEQADVVALNTSDRALSRKMRQAGYALTRRVAVWDEALKINNLTPVGVEMKRSDVEQLTACLNQIDAMTKKNAQGKAWREFVMLDELRQWCKQPDTVGSQGDEIARDVLLRLTQNSMTYQQRQFIAKEPFPTLVTELRRLTAEPLDLDELMKQIEIYEQNKLPSDAKRLALEYQSLAVSSDPRQRRLAEQIDAHYRNANLRVAISAELLNRLMPPRPLQYAPVRETVLGLPVRGDSLTSTEVAVRPLPDPDRLRIALEISGEVASQTSSTSGPATFYNRGRATYTARKTVDIDLDGFHSLPAQVDVRNEMRLKALETDFDNVPLLGSIVKGIAKSQFEQNRDASNREVRQKVITEAKKRIDDEAKTQLGEFSKRIQDRVLTPLYGLALDPTVIGAETTEHRMLMRLRLAGDDQLGSHTPRPQAPSNSLLSFQIHESTINNALQRLKLDGKTFSLLELSAHVAKKYNCEEPWEVNPENEDVKITFAASDALQVCCENNQIVLTISIAKLSSPPRFWKDFQVRVFYTPQIAERSAMLSRDGIVHLLGDHLNTGAQIALRGIFSKVFSKKTPLDLTPAELAESPQLADTEISQFTVDDGWIGVALSPKPAPIKTAQKPKELQAKR
jgi:hypothetical protein